MQKKTAVVFGGTGLVGSSLILELLESQEYCKIVVFSRRKASPVVNEKLSEQIVDFENPVSYESRISGDDIFICLGTTIKKAGSVSRMEEIDRDLPVSIAKAALKNGAKGLAVISSIGAGEKSANYYLRIKGEMERGILDLDFATTAVVRPSLLLGNRNEKRFGENAGKIFMKAFGVFFWGSFSKYRAIEGRDVARAMIRILNNNTGKRVYESDELRKLAAEK